MQEKTRYRLTKQMILRGRTNFQRLFDEGHGFRSRNLVLRYRVADANAPSKAIVAFLVPKKHGRAIDRNRVRRLMREAWRLEYPNIAARLPDKGLLHIGMIWSGKPENIETPALQEVQSDLHNGIDRLLSRASSSEPD